MSGLSETICELSGAESLTSNADLTLPPRSREALLEHSDLQGHWRGGACIEAWAAARAEALHAGGLTGGGLRTVIGELDAALLEALPQAVQGRADSIAMSELLRHAEHSLAASLQSAREMRRPAQIEACRVCAREVQDLAEALAGCRGRNADPQLAQRLEFQWTQLCVRAEARSIPNHGGSDRGLQKERAAFRCALASLRAAGEEAAEQRYLAADRQATALRKMLDGARTDFEGVVNLLKKVDPSGQVLLARVFEEKYGETLKAAPAAAAGRQKVRARSLFRHSAVREVLSEQFGVGVGIMQHLQFLFSRGDSARSGTDRCSACGA